jgi:hypothetical protein
LDIELYVQDGKETIFVGVARADPTFHIKMFVQKPPGKAPTIFYPTKPASDILNKKKYNLSLPPDVKLRMELKDEVPLETLMLALDDLDDLPQSI